MIINNYNKPDKLFLFSRFSLTFNRYPLVVNKYETRALLVTILGLSVMQYWLFWLVCPKWELFYIIKTEFHLNGAFI